MTVTEMSQFRHLSACYASIFYNHLYIKCMQKIICNRFEYCFFHEVACVTQDNIKMKPGFKLRQLPSRTIEYTKSDKRSDAGTVITETVKVKIGEETPLTGLQGAKVILSLYTSEGDRIIVGSLGFPAMYSYSQKLPETEITFTVKH